MKSPAQAGLFLFVTAPTLWQNAQTMQIEYELTQKDFIDAISTHRSGSAFRTWARWILLSLIGVLLILFLYDLLLVPGASLAKELMPFMVMAILWPAFLMFYSRWAMRRQFLKQPGARGPRTAILDTSGIHSRWDGGSSDHGWKNYIRAVEGSNQFLLYRSPYYFEILPKRALGAEQLNELRELLKQNIQTMK